MRNLKRVLSLTLASVMLLGMMVVGSSAAQGFPDVDDEDNVEAIEVLQAVSVMVGDAETGNFRPDSPVSRAEMAVIVAILQDLTTEYYVSTCPFTDVSGAYAWARGPVGACFASKAIAGRSATEFDPAATVTAVEAAAMLMRTLGYFQNPEDYADGFELSVVRQANLIGLFDGIGSDANTPMTRNQIAQMTLNTLKANLVDFTGVLGIEANGVKIGYQGQYTFRSGTDPKYKAISDLGNTTDGTTNQSYIQLGEQLYGGKLKLDDDIDAFGRPARVWEFDGTTIGTYIKEELLREEYVGGVTGKDLYDLLGSSVLDANSGYAITVTIDGEDQSSVNPLVFGRGDMNRNNNAKVGGTGTGVLTQVFVDNSREAVNRGRVYISVINTYLAIANKDYDEIRDELVISAYALKTLNSGSEYIKSRTDGVNDYVTIRLSAEELPIAADVKEKDALLITVAQGEVQTAEMAEVLAGVSISAFKLNSHVVSGGTQYDYTTTAEFKHGDLNQYTTVNGVSNLKDRTYNIYLDAYGNLIGLEEVEAVKNYVFIAGIDLDNSMLINGTAKASAIFLDGTPGTIEINMTKSTLGTHADVDGQDRANLNSILNTWCTYSKSNDGVYTVKEVSKVGVWTDGTPSTMVAGTGNVPKTGVNDTALAQIQVIPGANARTIDPKNMRLPGGAASGNFYYNVYGNKDTVYLTAELGELVKSTPGNYGIIKGVESVSVGIANTNLTVWTTAKAETEADDINVSGKVPKANATAMNNTLSQGAYVLYGDDGIIIAAVVVGEDAAASKDLVYVHSSGLNLESDNDANGEARAANDGLWTWSRDVIRNGEEVTLYEVGDDSSELKEMKQYQWYQIKTNAAGNVVSAVEVDDASNPALQLFDERKDTNGESAVFVADYRLIDDAMEASGVDTVLYQTDGGETGNNKGFGKTDKLSINSGNTLAVNTETGSGIHFRDDVNVVYQYWVKNAEEITIRVGGLSDLRTAVDQVNEYSATRNAPYYVSALIEDGFATTIVIYDSYNPYKAGSNGNNFNPSGEILPGGSNTVDIMDALNTYRTVTIDGNLRPRNVLGGSTATIVVNDGETLYVSGDIDYEVLKSGGGSLSINVAQGGKLIVRDEIVAKDGTFINNTINGTVEADSFEYNDSTSSPDDLTINGTLQTSGDVILSGDQAYDLIVGVDGEVIAGGNITKGTDASSVDKDLVIHGHVEASNVTPGSTGTILVDSTDSLIVSGSVTAASLTVGGGSGKPGYVTIAGSLDANLTITNDNKTVSGNTVGNTVIIGNGVDKTGALTVTISGGEVTIKNGVEASSTKTITISGGKVDIEANSSFDGTSKITVSSNATGTISGVTATAANAVTISSNGNVELADLTASGTGSVNITGSGDVILTESLDADKTAITNSGGATVVIEAQTEVSGTIGEIIAVNDDGQGSNIAGTTAADVELSFDGVSNTINGGTVDGSADVVQDAPALDVEVYLIKSYADAVSAKAPIETFFNNEGIANLKSEIAAAQGIEDEEEIAAMDVTWDDLLPARRNEFTTTMGAAPALFIRVTSSTVSSYAIPTIRVYSGEDREDTDRGEGNDVDSRPITGGNDWIAVPFKALFSGEKTLTEDATISVTFSYDSNGTTMAVVETIPVKGGWSGTGSASVGD